METILAGKPSRRVSIRCTQCGDIEQINDRSLRRKVKEGKPHVCRLCRQVRAAKPSQRDLDWCRRNFTQEEINEIAAAIWG